MLRLYPFENFVWRYAATAHQRTNAMVCVVLHHYAVSDHATLGNNDVGSMSSSGKSVE